MWWRWEQLQHLSNTWKGTGIVMVCTDIIQVQANGTSWVRELVLHGWVELKALFQYCADQWFNDSNYEISNAIKLITLGIWKHKNVKMEEIEQEKAIWSFKSAVSFTEIIADLQHHPHCSALPFDFLNTQKLSIPSLSEQKVWAFYDFQRKKTLKVHNSLSELIFFKSVWNYQLLILTVQPLVLDS